LLLWVDWPCVRWLEVKVGSVFIDDVGPAPRIVADQLPRVAGAAVVLREQDVARTDGERRTGLRLELERAGQGDDEPRDRVRLAGSPGGRWQRCDRARRCEIVEREAAFTEEERRALRRVPVPR
jgi:hypothetical protein